MAKDDDWSAEDDLEGQVIISDAATGEFERLKRSLRRQAGYDLTWFERLQKKVLGWFGVSLRFK